MKNTLKHKGYVARVDFDPDDGIFIGHVAGIEDSIGFHADNVTELVAAFEDAVNDYLDTCARVGKRAEKPFSGNVYIRVDPAVHAKVAVAAEIAGMSMNQFGSEALEKAAEQLLPT